MLITVEVLPAATTPIARGRDGATGGVAGPHTAPDGVARGCAVTSHFCRMSTPERRGGPGVAPGDRVVAGDAAACAAALAPTMG